jgi:hypothetical protein
MHDKYCQLPADPALRPRRWQLLPTVRERRQADRTGRLHGKASGHVTDGETELHIRNNGDGDDDDDESDVCAARTHDLHVSKFRDPSPLGPKKKFFDGT